MVNMSLTFAANQYYYKFVISDKYVCALSRKDLQGTCHLLHLLLTLSSKLIDYIDSTLFQTTSILFMQKIIICVFNMYVTC